jgi:hypothetical protein
MRNFTEKLGALIFPKKDSAMPDAIPFDFVKTKKGILKELVISNISGNVVGVYSRALGEGMFLAGVEKIESGGKEEIVVFNRHDMSGHLLARTRVAVDEIHMVCPFNRSYVNPLVNAERPGKISTVA